MIKFMNHNTIYFIKTSLIIIKIKKKKKIKILIFIVIYYLVWSTFNSLDKMKFKVFVYFFFLNNKCITFYLFTYLFIHLFILF